MPPVFPDDPNRFLPPGQTTVPPVIPPPESTPASPNGSPPLFRLEGFEGLNDAQAQRLQSILGTMAPRPKFGGFFEGLDREGRATVFDRDALGALLDGYNITNEPRAEFLRSILGGPAPPVPAGGGGGGGGRGGGGGGGGGHGGGGTTGNGFDESSFIPDVLDDAMIDRILQMLENPGIPEDVLEAMRASNREQGLLRERERLLRRADEFSGRGLFGGGVSNRDLERIEQEESAMRMQQEDQLNYQNALQALQSIQAAFGGTLGIGQLNLGERELEVRESLERAAIAAQRAIARGQLGLGYANLRQGDDQFAAQMALQQYLLNLQYGGSFNPGGFADPGGLPGGSGGIGGFGPGSNPFANSGGPFAR